MKRFLLKLMCMALTSFFAAGMNVNATDPVWTQTNVTAVYDYSNFGLTGSYNSITNPTNNTITRVYSNGSVSGHGRINADGTIDNSVWNVTGITLYNANGTIAKSYDPIAQRTEIFDVTGKITEAYSELNGQRYAADISRADNGSYTISWKGTMMKADGTAFKNADGSDWVGVTSVEHYDATGRILNSETYTLNEAGSAVILGAKTTYNYDQSGQLTLVSESTSKDGTTFTETSKTYYDGGRATRVERKDGDSGRWYTAQQYVYSGAKLVSIEGYDATGAHKSTTLFDAFGRRDKVVDPNANNRVITQYTYNDSGAAVAATTPDGQPVTDAQGNPITVAAGGVLRTTSYTYANGAGSDYLSKTDTYYLNGDISKPAKQIYSVNTAAVQNVYQNLNLSVWAQWGDPTAQGTITINEQGIIQFNVTSATEFQKILDGVQAALAGATQWAQSTGWEDNRETVDRWTRILDSLKTMWTNAGGTISVGTDGKVTASGTLTAGKAATLNVGAIDLSKLNAAVGGQANTTGHATSVSYNTIADNNLLNAITGMAGGLATLTWDYWTIDNSGNLWLFANAATKN